MQNTEHTEISEAQTLFSRSLQFIGKDRHDKIIPIQGADQK